MNSYQNKAVVYGILFRATAETLSTIAADPKHLGAETGFFAVLHSWGQNLLFHPHLHCVVPGGGISLDGTRWISCRPRFFLPVRVLSCLFRRLFLKYLEEAFNSGKLQFLSSLEALRDRQAFNRHLDPVRKLKWVVYAKPPFAGPQQVVDYVGRYTHRVAISNHRILDIEGGRVKFTWRDYRDNNQQKIMTLTADQFIGRFCFTSYRAGSTAFATTGSSATATARRSWSSAANFSAWLFRLKILVSLSHRRTIAIDMRDSRAILCGNAPSAIAAV